MTRKWCSLTFDIEWIPQWWTASKTWENMFWSGVEKTHCCIFVYAVMDSLFCDKLVPQFPASHSGGKKSGGKTTANPVKINLNHVCFLPQNSLSYFSDWLVRLFSWIWMTWSTSFHLVIVGCSHKPGGYELRPSQAGTWQCVSELSWPRLFWVSLSTPDYVCSVGVFS